MARSRQGCQAGELPALLLDLPLEGGEPAPGSGVKTLGSLAGLLQIGTQGGGLLLGVRPQHQAGVALGRKLPLGLGQELRKGCLRPLLQALDASLQAHDPGDEAVHAGGGCRLAARRGVWRQATTGSGR